jgi:hypothetical protein
MVETLVSCPNAEDEVSIVGEISQCSQRGPKRAPDCPPRPPPEADEAFVVIVVSVDASYSTMSVVPVAAEICRSSFVGGGLEERPPPRPPRPPRPPAQPS